MTTRCVFGDRWDTEVVSNESVDQLRAERDSLIFYGAKLAAEGRRNGVHVVILKQENQRTRWGCFRRKVCTVLVAQAE